MRYAKATRVGVARTQEQLRKLLRERGAAQLMFGEDDVKGQALLAFVLLDRHVRFVLQLPDPAANEFCRDRRGMLRAAPAAAKRWEQACRSSWRELFLLVKAMLVAVEAKIAMFEELFLPYFVTHGGQTVGERLRPELAGFLATGSAQLLLPASSESPR